MKITKDTENLSLLVKLASIAVHVDEYFSTDGHPFDKIAIESLLKDAEIKEFFGAMQMAGLLPEKRRK